MFFAILLSVWGAVHVILARRIVTSLTVRQVVKRRLYACVALHWTILPSLFLFRFTGGVSLPVTLFHWIGFTSAGFVAILFPMILVRDMGLLATVTIGKTVNLMRRETGQTPLFNKQRRRFIVNSMNIGLLAASGGLTGYGLYEARTGLRMVKITIPVRNLPKRFDGFTIAHITDTHISPLVRRDYMEKVVALANAGSPDMICITGDMVDGFVEDMRDDVAPLADLRAPHGVYYVTGNHEYYWDCPAWMREMKRLGIDVLTNEHRVIEMDGAKMVVAGVTDYWAERFFPEQKSDPVKAMGGAPESAVKLLLAHQPRSAVAAAAAGYDLMLAGHSHGGQFFPWNYVIPLLHPVPTGFSVYHGMSVYVSRGAAFWGPPLRIGPSPEVTIITLLR